MMLPYPAPCGTRNLDPRRPPHDVLQPCGLDLARSLRIVAPLILAVGIASPAGADVLDRAHLSPRLLFEEGRRLEFSMAVVSPDLGGRQLLSLGAGSSEGASSGDIARSYVLPGFGLKVDLSPRVSTALLYDRPFGADTVYPQGTGFYGQGTTAHLDAEALTALARFEFPLGFSLYGGARRQTLEAEVNLPFAAGYRGVAHEDASWGYIAGVAYERPEIALRASLTYVSPIEHEMAVTESAAVPGLSGEGRVTVHTPRSVILEVQSGIAPGTLAFGRVRWTEWTDFRMAPPAFELLSGGEALVSYEEDAVAVTIGIGRQISDRLSVLGSIERESAWDAPRLLFGPADGRTTLTVGAAYQPTPALQLSAGLGYSWLGEARTALTTPAGSVDAAHFEDASAWSAGVGIAINF